MPRLTTITFAMATLFATAAVVSAQSVNAAGHGTTNEALQYQNQYGQKASPYDYGTDNAQQSNQTYPAPSNQTYQQPNQTYAAPANQSYPNYESYQGAQQAPAYGDEYQQTAPVQTPVPAVDSGIEYPAPAVVPVAPYPYPYPYYARPYGYAPYYGSGISIGLGFGYGGYRGYAPYRGYGYRGGYIGGFRGGYRGPIGGGFRGGIGFHGGHR